MTRLTGAAANCGSFDVDRIFFYRTFTVRVMLEAFIIDTAGEILKLGWMD